MIDEGQPVAGRRRWGDAGSNHTKCTGVRVKSQTPRPSLCSSAHPRTTPPSDVSSPPREPMRSSRTEEDLALLNVKARDVHEAGAVPWNFDIADFVHCGVSLATSQVGVTVLRHWQPPAGGPPAHCRRLPHWHSDPATVSASVRAHCLRLGPGPGGPGAGERRHVTSSTSTRVRR